MQIVFDLGGVLSSETSQVRDVAKALGVEPHEASKPYWLHRHDWDAGWSDGRYWRAVASDMGLEIDDARVAALTRRDLTTWTTLRRPAEQILRDVAASGTPAHLLSNAAASFVDVVNQQPWRAHLQQLFISGALGLTKPDAAIYEHVEKALDVDPGQLHFVDDRPENVEAALARGWQAHLWVDDADTRAWLVGLGVLEK